MFARFEVKLVSIHEIVKTSVIFHEHKVEVDLQKRKYHVQVEATLIDQVHYFWQRWQC
jgi:hypothetical protein